MNRLLMLLRRLRHPRRRYFVSVDIASDCAVTAYGYREGNTVHITAIRVEDAA